MAYQSLMNITILLLVSDPIVRSILKETLEHEGYTVVAAGDLAHLQMAWRTLPIPAQSLDDERLQSREALQGFEVFPRAVSLFGLRTTLPFQLIHPLQCGWSVQ